MITVNNEKLLTRREAAEYLGYTYNTMTFYAKSKEYGPPYRRVGWKAYYSLKDLDSYLNKITTYKE